MNEDVSETGKASPVDLLMGACEFVGQPLTGFGHGLKVPQDGILVQSGIEKRLLAATDEVLDAVNALGNVDQIQPIVFQS